MEDFDGGFLQSSQKRDYREAESLRRLTARQVREIEGDGNSVLFTVDRAAVLTIQLCGFVTSTKKISAGTIFELEDTTGQVECLAWPATLIGSLADLIQEGRMLRVTGQVKVFANRKTVNVSGMCSAEGNDLLEHLTGSLYEHLFFTNRLKREEERHLKSEFSPIQRDVLEVYKNNQDENGLETEVVVAILRDKYSEKDVKNTIEGLLGGCHLHSVDGSCYKTTI